MTRKKVFILISLLIIITIAFILIKSNTGKKRFIQTEDRISYKTEKSFSEKPQKEQKKEVKKIEPEKEKKLEKLTEPKKERPQWLKEILSMNKNYRKNWSNPPESSISAPSNSSSSKPNFSTSSTSTNISSFPPATTTATRSPLSSTKVSPEKDRAFKKDTQNKSSSGTPLLPQYGNIAETGENPASEGNQQNEKANENNEEGSEENENNQDNNIRITRNISLFSGGANITLDIEIMTDISGLIITETIPPNYTITSSSPQYAKKTGNTYKWLFYGKNIPSQSINYTLQGEGGGTITGSYKTTAESGVITGNSSL